MKFRIYTNPRPNKQIVVSTKFYARRTACDFASTSTKWLPNMSSPSPAPAGVVVSYTPEPEHPGITAPKPWNLQGYLISPTTRSLFLLAIVAVSLISRDPLAAAFEIEDGVDLDNTWWWLGWSLWVLLLTIEKVAATVAIEAYEWSDNSKTLLKWTVVITIHLALQGSIEVLFFVFRLVFETEKWFHLWIASCDRLLAFILDILFVMWKHRRPARA